MSDKDPKNTQNTQNSGGKKPMTPPKSGQSGQPKAPANQPAQNTNPVNNPTNRRPMTPPKTNGGQGKNGQAAGMIALGVVGAAAAAAFLLAGKDNKGSGTASNNNNNPNGGGLFNQAVNKITKQPSHASGKVTFADVAGIDEVKEDLQEVVALIKGNNAGRKSLGGKAPKGALLYGDPGCGKTLIAKAIANEAGVNFISRSGSDFVEKYVGVGAQRVREMFKEARKAAPCVLFIDEIDGVARHRSGVGGENSGAREHDQTINALLVEMDGMNGRDGVFIIGATNRLDLLDPAAKRPGRFDRKINVPLPDVEGREKILEVHTRNKIVDPQIDLKLIARATPRFSGADLENLANEAALLAERQNKDFIEMVDFETAKDKIMMGSGRTLKMSEDERKLTAWHEAGHALVALMEEASDPILKATILPRGGALGMVVRVPEGDQYSMSKAQMWAHLSVAAAGRAAEEVYYGNDDDVTSGAASDIQQMSNIAEKMVTEWGLSSLGMRNFSTAPDPKTGARRSFSQATHSKIDKEVDSIVEQSYTRAKDILIKDRKALDAIAEALLDKETLTGPEIEEIARKAGANIPTRKAGGAAPKPVKPAQKLK